MPPHPRLYPLDLANAALPLVRSILTELVEAVSELERVRRQFDRVDALPEKPQAELNALYRELARLEADCGACRAELDGLGLVLDDAEIGVCDFPAELDGEPVMLCWKLGEQTLAAFHGRDEGFAHRRPLPVAVPQGA